MATRLVVDAVVKTVDELPAGGAISELDTFLAMQGVATARKACKLTGMQLKDFIALHSVSKIEAGENITVSPVSIDGSVTVSMTATFPFIASTGDRLPISLTQE